MSAELRLHSKSSGPHNPHRLALHGADTERRQQGVEDGTPQYGRASAGAGACSLGLKLALANWRMFAGAKLDTAANLASSVQTSQNS